MSWLLIIGLKNAILVAPLAVLALAIGRYSKRPALAHVLWLIVLVKLLTPPLVDVPVGWRINVESLVASSAPAQPVAVVEATEESPLICPRPDTPRVATDSQAAAPAGVDPAACDPAPAKPVTTASRVVVSRGMPWLRSSAFWIGLAGAIWLAGSGVAMILLVVRAWRFHRFVRLAARIDDRLEARVARLAASVGLGHGPRVVVVDGVVSPMLWGVGRATRLIFPARLAERLDDAEVDSLLLHELAHYGRGDHWVRLLELAVHVLYWWHPVVWLARREIEAAEEQCCDAWVIQHQHGSRRSYAEALLTTIDFLCEPQLPAALPPAACGLGDVPLLRTRLTQIMKGQLAIGLSRGVQVLLLSIGVIISPLQPALWATSSPARPKPARNVPAAPAVDVSPAAESQPSSSTPSSPAAQPEAAPAPVSTAITSVPQSVPSSPLRWSALSPDSSYRLENRRDRTTLVRERTVWRLDLSSYGIKCAAFAPDSRSFITGHEDGTIRWWDCWTGGQLNSYGDRSGPIESVAFGSDNRIAAGSADGSVTVIDLKSGEETRLSGLPHVASVRWSPAGDRLAIGLGSYQDSAGGIVVWDPQSSATPEEHALQLPVAAIDWLGDSAILIADWSGQCQSFDVATGETTLAPKVQKMAVSAAASTRSHQGPRNERRPVALPLAPCALARSCFRTARRAGACS
jgi:beta-lactamase regulating signal transducer with metallopeptidase domain